MVWRWDKFVIFCLLLIFTGWLAGFVVPMWLATIVGGLIGLIAGMQGWFEDQVVQPQRGQPRHN